MVNGFEKAMACSRARPEPGPLHWPWLGQGFEKAEAPSGRAKAGAPRPSRAGTSLKFFGDESDQDQSQTSKEGCQPPSFHEVAKRYVTTLRTTLDANEARSLAGSKVACPVLLVRRFLVRPSLFTRYSIDGAGGRG